MAVEPKVTKDPTNPSMTTVDYWEPAKRVLLSNPKFLQGTPSLAQLLLRSQLGSTDLLEYDKDNIDARIVRKLKEFVYDPEFDPVILKKASLAAAGLADWVRAVLQYDAALKV